MQADTLYKSISPAAPTNNKKTVFQVIKNEVRERQLPTDIETEFTASQLFSLFTADIIKQETVFTR